MDERERNRIRTDERTRITAKIVSSIADQLLSDLQESESSGQSSFGKKPTAAQREAKKPQKFYPKNNQRGSQSLSSLNTSETKNTRPNSGAYSKNTSHQKTFQGPPNSSSWANAPPMATRRAQANVPFRAKAPPTATPRAHANPPPRANPPSRANPPPRALPRKTAGAPTKELPRNTKAYAYSPPSAPPMDPSCAPPSYEESVQQQTPFSRQPFISAPPPLLNNPYLMQGYDQNYQIPGSGYQAAHFSQPTVYSNFPRPMGPFHPQNRFQYNGPHPQQKSFPGTGHISQNFQTQKAEAPNSIPRSSIQNESKNTDPSLDSKSQKQDKDDKINIDINVIVRKLSDCDRYFSFLKNLSQILDINSSDLLKIVKEKNEIFLNIYDPEKKDSVVELCPKIELCKDHQKEGCIVKECSKIHLCEDFIFSDCTRKDCPLGHMNNFKSNHNVNILKKYYMAILPNATLQQLFKKVCNRTLPPQICFDYHQEKCQFADNCRNIHICNSYVNNLGLCSNDNCSFTHNIRDAKILATFKALGISTNESPRDLLKVLKDMCIEKEGKNIGTKDLPKATSVSDDKQEESTGKDTKRARNQKNKETKKTAGANPQAENSTRTSHCTNFQGPVIKPKVCIDGMKRRCKFIHNGCYYLHCRHKSHWQFGSGDKWYNFHLYHSQILDSKFSDPNCEDVDLPKLDYSRLIPSQKDLITVLGKKSLKVDFKKMTLYCESMDSTYSLRNLTTDSSVLGNNDDNLNDYTIFKWYFKDDDEQFKLFNNIDSSSDIIEKAYIKDPNGILKFDSGRFSYSIDFTKMTQENESTHKIRSLKRRPYIPRNEKANDMNKKETEEKIQLPKTWDDMKGESFKKVQLGPSDQEYMDLRQILFLSLPQINIINVWRIQNEFLWQKFTNKRIALEKQYNDSFLNIQKLFHGIDSESVDDIIRENFEFRRHSITSSRPYGDGTYFYNRASAGAEYCNPDSTGKNILLIAEVIIGKVSPGSPGLTRPPENPVYNVMFDSTTDNIQNPSVYVKYSTLEYYPAYIVEFI